MAYQSVIDEFPYHIVEFVTAGRKPKVRKTDIVATKWLHYDKQKKRLLRDIHHLPTTKKHIIN